MVGPTMQKGSLHGLSCAWCVCGGAAPLGLKGSSTKHWQPPAASSSGRCDLLVVFQSPQAWHARSQGVQTVCAAPVVQACTMAVRRKTVCGSGAGSGVPANWQQSGQQCTSGAAAAQLSLGKT